MMNINDINKRLKQRPPFQMIERVIELTPNEWPTNVLISLSFFLISQILIVVSRLEEYILFEISSKSIQTLPTQ